jgi:hypothetical protein
MTIADGLRSVGGFTEEEFADPSLKTIVHCVRKSGASCIETAFDRVFHLGMTFKKSGKK